MTETYSVFYSWQSDLPKSTNQSGIRQCLRSSINKIEENKDEYRIELDEATRNTTGSPNIPQTIFSKIEKSDVFVCDLTTINTESNCKRKVSNPNVLIELGFAVATLGWERIILLFNSHYGKFPDDLPFDIDRHRASQFIIKDKSDKSGKGQLTSLLTIAIQPILETKPLKPSERKALSPAERKRELDINNLKWLMSSININIFDNFIENMPTILISKMMYFKDWFSSILQSSNFHIYDEKLSELIKEFAHNYEKSFSYYKYYIPDGFGKSYRFQIPFDVFPDQKTEDDFNELTQVCIRLRTNFSDLLAYIRSDYLEIDLEETSEIAFNAYVEDVAEKN
jgi:hypothetical protein